MAEIDTRRGVRHRTWQEDFAVERGRQASRQVSKRGEQRMSSQEQLLDQGWGICHDPTTKNPVAMSARRDEGEMQQGGYLEWELRGSCSVGLAVAVSMS